MSKPKFIKYYSQVIILIIIIIINSNNKYLNNNSSYSNSSSSILVLLVKIDRVQPKMIIMSETSCKVNLNLKLNKELISPIIKDLWLKEFNNRKLYILKELLIIVYYLQIVMK